MRQQVLAGELERDERVKAGRVSVVDVLSPDNTAYQGRTSPRDCVTAETPSMRCGRACSGGSEAFAKLDPTVFLDPAVTSEEYVLRYGGIDA